MSPDDFESVSNAPTETTCLLTQKKCSHDDTLHKRNVTRKVFMGEWIETRNLKINKIWIEASNAVQLIFFPLNMILSLIWIFSLKIQNYLIKIKNWPILKINIKNISKIIQKWYRRQKDYYIWCNSSWLIIVGTWITL